jgi:hypothetical protein
LERNVYWIAYVTLGLAVGAIIGYVQGHKQGVNEAMDVCESAHRLANSIRAKKAAATRKSKALRDAEFAQEVAP